MMNPLAGAIILAGEEGGGVQAITTGVSNLLSLAGTMLTEITGNPILTLFFSAGVVSIAIGIVRRLKRV